MSQPPTGTVTFLFTDVQNSTKLWAQHPDAMRHALARHDQILRECIEAHDGFLVKTTGDGVHAAFHTAPDALATALSAQLTLQQEPWDPETPLLVRMGLHTGACEEREGDYFGTSLNRAARLMAAGSGGQVLLSEATQALVCDALPPDVLLLSLGQHRLKDLGRPEHVFQAIHPLLPADFPPLRSLDNPALPNNLPQQATSFIGREKQVKEVKVLLGKTRLLTLTGTGGSGKTRLSLQVAADLLDGEGDGVWLVELAALANPVLVPGAVAQVLGIKEEPGKPIQQTLVAALKDKRLLIVLDNCEHLVAACASLAADLIRNCPEVHILASSREPLNVSGEQTYRVPTLTLPDPKKTQTVESLSQYEAVRLFIERAQAVQASFAVTDANALAVAQVCLRLDGIPLAIELAAARTRSLSVGEINNRLDDRFHLLTGGSRTALPRQQTLRALIDWSYDLLTEAEKTLLRRLSVFAGGWTLKAAEGICSGDAIEDFEVLDLLTGLVDKSLAVYEEGADGDAGRYRLLETVRQYALDQLGENREAVQGWSASWFLGLAEEAEPQLRGPEQASWLSRLEAEHDNLRASLAWEEQRAEGGEDGLRLAGALWRFWFVRGHLSEGRQWLGRALARSRPKVVGEDGTTGREPSAARAKALHGSGNLARMQGDYAEAWTLHEQSLVSLRQLGDQSGAAESLNDLGHLALRQGDYAEARTLYEESLPLFRQLGDQQGIAFVLSGLGSVAFGQGDYAGARVLHEESLTIRRQIGDSWSAAWSLNNLAGVACAQGDYAEARALYEESLAVFRQLGDRRGIANALNGLGHLACAQGDYAGARALYEESLTMKRQLGNQVDIAGTLTALGNVAFGQGDYAGAGALYEESLTLVRQLGDRFGIADGLDGMARVAQGQGQPSRAAQLGEAASVLRESLGSPRPPAFQVEADKTMASVREALGKDAFAAALDAGRAMPWEQAVEYALSESEK